MTIEDFGWFIPNYVNRNVLSISFIESGESMIDNVEGFIRSAFEVKELRFPSGSTWRLDARSGVHGDIYCPKCGGVRRATVSLCSNIFGLANMNGNSEREVRQVLAQRLHSSLWHLTCTQCDTLFVVVFYKHVSGLQMVLLPDCEGGVVTQHTPEAVAYYLDQAYRSKCTGANSACMAMYRAALDQLLFHEGYREGMLGRRLSELEKDVKDGSGPKWTRDLDIGLLQSLNALGSGSIHPNDGDVKKQRELDLRLLEMVDTIFGWLLDRIYEQPEREQGWRAVFDAKKPLLKK